MVHRVDCIDSNLRLLTFSFFIGTTLSLNQLLSDPWKHCKDAQGRQGHVEVQLFYENHRTYDSAAITRNDLLILFLNYT